MKIDARKSRTRFVMAIIATALTCLTVWLILPSPQKQTDKIKLTIKGIFPEKTYFDVSHVYFINDTFRLENLEGQKISGFPSVQTSDLFLNIPDQSKRIMIRIFPPGEKNVKLLGVNLTQAETTMSLFKSDKVTELRESFFSKEVKADAVPENYRKNNICLVSDPIQPNPEVASSRWFLVYLALALLILMSLFFSRFSLRSFFFYLVSLPVFATFYLLLSGLQLRTILFEKKTAAPVMELQVLAPYDDRISVYFLPEELNNKAYDDFMQKVTITGSPDFQKVTFPWPEDYRVDRIRIYFSQLPMGIRKLSGITFRKLDQSVTITPDMFHSFFPSRQKSPIIATEPGSVSFEILDQSAFWESYPGLWNYYGPTFRHRINQWYPWALSAVLSLLFWFWLMYRFKPKEESEEINLQL